ncbi:MULTISPECIES: MFS transporter [Pseudomonadota]|uniref:Tetracycline resistance protein, class C n=10 Tax=Enterobacteriaceae TaxID=543 RepID=A0A2R4AHQ5_ECOLX|nr:MULTISPECIES: MFS transporter [Pseudomonadota]AVR63966.1 Tetracycline resistance protein, class C [Escherichia coli]AVR64146.1 Tetracycline resistance protein, class C [Escherichia coli]KFL46882.1 putative transposase [Sphingobium sp. ba1]WEG85443.1 tetA [Escherichia coli]
MENIALIGIDLGKNSFHIHCQDRRGKAVYRKKFTRPKLIEFLATCPATTIAMEACGGSHFMARKLEELGHSPKLISPQFVRPFVKSNKNDFVDYAIMATAPFLWVLYIGRIVAGITGATGAVAGAYIADITDGDERARHFGFMSACFGFGMVAGPVLGGLMGGFSPHAPFFAAAALNGLNFLTGCFLLPESHKGERRPLRREALNPLASFRWARGMTVVAALMAVFFIMQLVGQVPAALWVIFGEDRFHWDATTIGISLAAFGILHSLAQAMITGPVAARLGERRALMLGMIADGTGYILLAFATRGWMAFPIMVLLASGGIGMPALQAMLSRQVDEERQGQLQGSLAALTSLTSIVGPLLFTAIYAASITTWNGWAWIAGAALYLLCLPALRRGLWSGAGQRADR